MISKTQFTLGVLNYKRTRKMYQAFPSWKHHVRRLNEFTSKRAKEYLEQHLAPIIRLDPYCNEYLIELQTLKRHLTESDGQLYTEIIRSVLDSKENRYLYDMDTGKYRKYDIIR